METAFFAVFAFALGSAVASFLNVVADRLPAEGSLISPPSHCPVDEHRLAWFEMIPVLSYVFLRGRCRVCGSRIPFRVLAVELVGGAMYAWVVVTYGLSLDALLLIAAFSLLLVITIIDLEHKLVLNKVLIYGAYPVALVSAPLWSTDLREPIWGLASRQVDLAVDAVAAGAIGFILLLVIAVVSRGMGGGDIKLAGAIGLWVGLRQLPVALFLAVVLGGITAIILLIIRRSRRKDAIPFAPFLCIGTATSLVYGTVIWDWYIGILSP